MDEHAERLFRNEQRRHRDAVSHTVDALGPQVERIQRRHEAGQDVSSELRALMNDVIRGFERATALDALNEVAFAFDKPAES